MRRWLPLTVLLLIVGAQGAMADVVPPEDQVRVQVGAKRPDTTGYPFSYTRFYPEHLNVHRGQTVLFETVESVDLHSVNIWPAAGGDRPAVVRTDEGSDRFAVNEPAWQRSPCGGSGQQPCVADGTQGHLSSGLTSGTPILFETTWRVRVDAPVGTLIGFLCMVHPGMAGSIRVVDDGVSLPSQHEIDALTAEQIAADTDEAIAHKNARDGQEVWRTEGDRQIRRVLVGDATPSGHVSIMAYMPSDLEIGPGQGIEFVSSGIGHHSVAFPGDLVGTKSVGPGSRLSSFAIHPACDLDELDGGAPGISGPWAPLSPASCPGTFELVLSPYLANQNRARDDQVATPLSLHNSGLMWAENAPEAARGRPADSGRYFPHRFLAAFDNAGTYTYGCTVHGADNMTGVIEVR